MKKSIIISTLLCVLMCITTFAWANSGFDIITYLATPSQLETNGTNGDNETTEDNGDNETTEDNGDNVTTEDNAFAANSVDGNFTDSSVNNSDTIIINIGGGNSGDVHVGDGDTVADQDEVECEECLRAVFDGSSMILVLPRVEYFDPGLFKVTTWFMEIDFSTGKSIITDTHLVE